MNILFFFSETGIGGAETNFLKIGREFKNSGHKLYVIALYDRGPLLHQFAQFADAVELIGPITNPFRLLRRLKKVIKKNNIDVVFNFGLKVEIISRLFSKWFGVKKIVSNIRSTDDWRKWYHTWLDRITAFNVAFWVSNSEAGKRAFVKRERHPADRITVIHNYIEFTPPTERSKAPIHSSLLRIGILSNIKRGKGFEDLIPLSKELLRKGIAHRFIIAGKDNMNGVFQQTIKEESLGEHFGFLGFTPNKDAFFESIDLFLLPTYWEGLPTSILEAMAYGKPILSTDVGGIPEMVKNNVNGLLVKPGDILGFSEAVYRFSTEKELTERFVNESYRVIIKQFEKSVIVASWQALLDNLEDELRNRKEASVSS